MHDRSNVISAFTEDQAERLTGVSKSQLRYWDRTKFYAPSLGAENRRLAFSRIYSFRDVACLQILNTLRNDIGVSLHHLREVKDRLSHLGDAAWTKTTLYVLKKKVVFVDPDSGKPREVASGQFVLEIPLRVVQANIAKAVAKMRVRGEAEMGGLERNRYVAHNQWVVAGTRVSVRSIREFAAEGYTVQDILEQYPTLTARDVEAALSRGKAA